MLGSYASLAQELGRLPTNGDLGLKKRHDSDVPNSKTYEIRFGSKLELVAQLATYCASQSEHANALALSQDYITKNRAATMDEGLREKKQDTFI